jgi:hypothetical protein
MKYLLSGLFVFFVFELMNILAGMVVAFVEVFVEVYTGIPLDLLANKLVALAVCLPTGIIASCVAMSGGRQKLGHWIRYKL